MGDTTPSDMDGGWKQIIEDFIEEFFRFYFPNIHASINFKADIQFLDKELAKIMVDTQTGNRNYRPDRFQREKGGCRLEFQFPTVKLLDHKTEAQLLADPSPFAIVSLVQLRKLQAGSDKPRRHEFKLALTRELYSRNYAKDDIIKLFRFMDYILRLPKDLAIQFRSELESIEEKQNMPYVTSVERLAKEEGIEQGNRNFLLQTIQIRFGQVPDSLRESILACNDTEQLTTLHRQALTAKSLTDLPPRL